MTDQILSKEETIKAVECCFEEEFCDDCPLHEIKQCDAVLYKSILAYIRGG
jgi:hypothetical protein